MENREKVPVRYRKNAQTAALLDTLGLSAQQMADLVEDVKKQFFIETATWSLPLWEYQVGITPPANATETSRRNAIKAHLLAGGNTNADTVRDMATAMTGYAARVIMNDDYRELFHGGERMTAALISAAAAVVVALIEAIAARDRRRDKKEREKAAEQQKMQEQLMLKLIEGSWAAIALGEATAKAMQRIPDAHCNGDMHAALDYAAEVKHKQKEFLAERGIHSILDSGAAA